MQQAFLEFIKKEKLFKPSEKILLTVSGGVDSVAMCELFHKAGFQFGIAHCNFQLRGKESDDDEKLVAQLAKKYDVPFYAKRFDTEAYVAEKNVSVQMAARKLRYKWFFEICKSEKYNYVATAHHQDDSVETFFINLIRGTGIAGLHGILPKQWHIIRPLLFAEKKQIVEFAENERLKFREDSSNASDKYLRNKIRHHIIPALKELNPTIETSINSTIERLRNVELIYEKEVERTLTKIINEVDDYITISKKELKKLNPFAPYFYELLKIHNFNSRSIQEITNALDGESGKQFLSDRYRLIIDRENIIIEERKDVKDGKADNIKLTFKILNSKSTISESPKTASLDYDKLTFPLEIRKWEKGDYFYPLGMKGKKKLSDFFIDNKLPLNRKENIWLLTSNGKIVWVIGMRIDNRFKITDKTKKIYFAELVK